MNMKTILLLLLATLITACGKHVEVPPAHLGKIMTKDGYQENLIPTSKFRLPWCWAYCDRLVLLDISDRAFNEALHIFIPKDKLNLSVDVRTTLTINQSKTEELFNAIPPTADESDHLSKIELQRIYQTYAQQIVMTETREYLSQFSIAEIASSMETINNELRHRLTQSLAERTPFAVRYVGITKVGYPDIITDAQENAAKRREQIQQEEAQLEISKVTLERELQEARLRRQTARTNPARRSATGNFQSYAGTRTARSQVTPPNRERKS